VRRVLGVLVLTLLLPLQAALASVGCTLDVPETAAVGEAVSFTGTVFDNGSVAHFFIGDSVIASGPVSEGGLLSVIYAFGDEGNFWVQMVGLSQGDWCASPLAAIAVGAGGSAGEAPDGAANLAAAQILTTTTVVLSEGAFGDGFAIGPDDLEPALTPEAHRAAVEEARQAAAEQEVTASTDATSVPTASSSDDEPAAATPLGQSGGETSVLPLALLIGLVTAVLGLGAGWVTARRRS